MRKTADLHRLRISLQLGPPGVIVLDPLSILMGDVSS